MTASDGLDEIAKFLRRRDKTKTFVYSGPEVDNDRHINLSIAWNLSLEGLRTNADQGRDPVLVALIQAYRLGFADGSKDGKEREDQTRAMVGAVLKLIEKAGDRKGKEKG